MFLKNSDEVSERVTETKFADMKCLAIFSAESGIVK
jgi:hypothetical protein